MSNIIHFRVKKEKSHVSKTTAEYKHSTVVSGTTPSGCTQRAPTDPIEDRVDQSTWSNDGKTEIIKPKADCQQSTLALGTTPSGCTQRAPANTEFIRHTQWVTNTNPGKEKFLVAYPTEQTAVD